MRTISFKTNVGNAEIEVTSALVEHISKKNCIPSDAVSDAMILSFFRDASNAAFQKAATEYLDSDGKDT